MSVDKIQHSISDRRRWFEILAVAVTGAGKFIFMDLLNYRFPFIIVSVVAWTVYIGFRSKNLKGIPEYWGFRTDNFKQVLRMVLPFGLVAVLLFFAVGLMQNSIHLTWHIVPILIIYPVWGIIQQFLVIGLVAGNLQDLDGILIPKGVVILVTALLFGLIHYPWYWLVLGTFILALFYGYVYLRCRNLYVLGILHGWLGGLFFYTIVGRDPFQEVFGRYLNL